VEAQIHAGGRERPEEVKKTGRFRRDDPPPPGELASHILGMTSCDAADGAAGPRGAPLVDLKKDWTSSARLYLGLLIDRETGRPVFMAAPRVAWKSKKLPRTIQRHSARTHHPAVGLQPYQARKIAFGLGLSGELATVATPVPTGALSRVH